LTIEVNADDPDAGLPTLGAVGGNFEQIVKPPVIRNERDQKVKAVSFTESIDVIIESQTPGAQIRYTLDGSEPIESSQLYTKPIKLTSSATVKAIAVKNGSVSVRSTSASFYKITKYKEFVLKNPASPKYPGKGEMTLVDGHRGSMDFRDGNWLGFEEDDLDVSIDFGKTIPINKITVGFLQDIGSWIFLPPSIEFSISKNSKKFKAIATLTLAEIKASERGNLRDVSKEFKNIKARYVRIRAKNIGTCPESHAGAGGKAWLFVDEVIVE